MGWESRKIDQDIKQGVHGVDYNYLKRGTKQFDRDRYLNNTSVRMIEVLIIFLFLVDIDLY